MLKRGKVVFFRKGTGFEVGFTGEDGALYEYRTRLIARKRDNIPLLVIGAPDPKSTRRIQRRQNVRVPDSLEVSLFAAERVISTISRNISAGGMAVRWRGSANLHTGDEVICKFLLPSATPKMMEFSCEVVRCAEDEDFTNVSLKFKDITSIEENILTKYVFSKQIDLRRKGVI